MKEYIKYFATPEDGHEYEIKDIPWICSVGSTGQNLVCNVPGKQTFNINGVLIIDNPLTIIE